MEEKVMIGEMDRFERYLLHLCRVMVSVTITGLFILTVHTLIATFPVELLSSPLLVPAVGFVLLLTVTEVIVVVIVLWSLWKDLE